MPLGCCSAEPLAARSAASVPPPFGVPFVCAGLPSAAAIRHWPAGSVVPLSLRVRNDHQEHSMPLIHLNAASGAGDQGEPVDAKMLPNENLRKPGKDRRPTRGWKPLASRPREACTPVDEPGRDDRKTRDLDQREECSSATRDVTSARQGRPKPFPFGKGSALSRGTGADKIVRTCSLPLDGADGSRGSAVGKYSVLPTADRPSPTE
jgi:hypothetical protein